jgi:hypothetical protein
MALSVSSRYVVTTTAQNATSLHDTLSTEGISFGDVSLNSMT